MKRVLDVIGSAALFALFSPVMLIACLAIRISSPGPIYFSHDRWGLDEKPFVCFKLRSMFINGSLREGSKDGVLKKLQKDPRVTKVGAFLRKTSIDELPQLINVLRGDMSLVGPRPLVMHMMEPYPELRQARCVVRPGITGLWQLRNRRNNTRVFDMIEYDLEYIESFTLWLDIKLLVETVPAVLFKRDAY